LDRLIMRAEKADTEIIESFMYDLLNIGKSLRLLESVIQKAKGLICEHTPDRPFNSAVCSSIIRMECDELAFLCRKALKEEENKQCLQNNK